MTFALADYSMTQKSFNFPQKHHLPFYFVSASDGTNVVKVARCRSRCVFLSCNSVVGFQVFREAIKAAIIYKENSTDFVDEVMRELEVRKGNGIC